MDDTNDLWINLPKYSQEYIKEIKEFIKNAFPKVAVGEEKLCPCRNYKNIKWHHRDIVYDHLICSPNSCMLYWGEYEKEEGCRICGLSRWVVVTRQM